MTWESQAQQVASGAGEIGEDAALIVAAAWRARVDPRATDGLAGAALALWATPSSLVRGGGQPLPHDREMITRAGDLETDTASLLKRARETFDGAAEAHEAACLAAAAAAAQAAAARNREEASAAASALAEAQRQIADCEAALEMLQDAGQRLRYAAACLARVPDDLAETYDVCYSHIRRGGTLPYDGDFLTGVPACPR
jgi:hypothetical protein